MAKVLYLGGPGTFSHMAALKMCHQSDELVAMHSLDVLVAKSGEMGCDAIIPIENTTTGLIRSSVDMWMSLGLYATEVYDMPIHHHVYGLKQDALVKKIIVQHEVYEQCKSYINQRYDAIVLTASTFQAKTAYDACKDEPVHVVLPHTLGACDDVIIAKDIQTLEGNTTRFVRLSCQPHQPLKSGCVMASFALEDQIGSLATCLKALSTLGINLNAIHSRPHQEIKKAYLFYMEMTCLSEATYRNILEVLSQTTKWYKIMGYVLV